MFDYSRKGGVLHAEIMLPSGVAAPEWMLDRQELWSRLEETITRKNGRLATEFTIALPAALDAEQRLALARDYVQQLADRYGVAADFALHEPSREGDQRNFHAHVMLTSLKVNEQGFGAQDDFSHNWKTRQAKGLLPIWTEIKTIREAWAQTANLHLAQAGLETRIDPRSFRERGIEIEPTRHLGPKATALARGHRETLVEAITPDGQAYNATLIREKPEQLLELIASREAVFTRQEIAIAVHRYVGSNADYQAALAAVMNSPELVQLQGDLRVTGAGRQVEILGGRQLDAAGAEITNPTDRATDKDNLVDVARFSTRTMVVLESGMVERATALSAGLQAQPPGREAQADPLAPARQGAYEAMAAERQAKDGKAFALTVEQQRAVEHVTGANRLALVLGVAGAGKSTMLEAARRTWGGAGYNVVGAALAAKAASGLWDSSGIESRTIESLVRGWDARDQWNALPDRERGQLWLQLGRMSAEQRQAYAGPKPPPRNLITLTEKSVLVIDEAGMVDSRTMARLVEEVDRRGAKLVLVGDPGQLPAIQSGAAFRAMSERVGYVEIATVYRQREQWQRDATMALSKGRVGDALDAYSGAGRVTFTDDLASARGALVADYLKDWADRPNLTRAALAYRNADVDALNASVRQARRDGGYLGADVSFVATRGRGRDGQPRELTFAAGDRVHFLANGLLEVAGALPDSRGRVPGHKVDNSDLGTVVEAADGRVVVRLDGERQGQARPLVVVDQAAYAAIDHGYAITIHKAQGATVDHAFVLPNALDRALSYVALSRHRESVRLYAARDELQDLDALKAALGRWTFKQSTLDYARGFQSPALADYRDWTAEEGRRRLDAFAAKRAAVVDSESWAQQKAKLKAMTSAEIAAAAVGLAPAPIKPSDIEAHPKVQAAQAAVDSLERRHAQAVRDLAAAVALKAEGEQYRRPALVEEADRDIRRATATKTALLVDIDRAQSAVDRQRADVGRQLEQRQQAQRARHTYTVKALDASIGRDLRQGAAASRQALDAYKGMTAPRLAASLRKSRPVEPSIDSVRADPAVQAAARAVEVAQRRLEASPTVAAATALEDARQAHQRAQDDAATRQQGDYVMRQATWSAALPVLERAIAREQRHEIAGVVRHALHRQKLDTVLELTPEQRAHAQRPLEEFRTALEAWKSGPSPRRDAGAAASAPSAEQKAQRDALRAALRSKADRVLADPAVRTIALEQRVYAKAERFSSANQRAFQAEVASRRNAAVGLERSADLGMASLNQIAGAASRTADRQHAGEPLQAFRDSLDRYRASFTAENGAAPNATDQRAQRTAMADELRIKADAVLAQPAATREALDQRLAAAVVRHSSLGRDIDQHQVIERRQALLAEASARASEVAKTNAVPQRAAALESTPPATRDTPRPAVDRQQPPSTPAPKPQERSTMQPKSNPPNPTPQPDRARQAAEEANPFLRNEGDTSRIAGVSKEQLKADSERHDRRTAEQNQRNRDAGQQQGRRRDDDRDRSR